MGYQSTGNLYNSKGYFVKEIKSKNGLPNESYDNENYFFFGENSNFISFNLIFPKKYNQNRYEKNFVNNILNYLIENIFYKKISKQQFYDFLKKENHKLILFRKSMIYKILCHFFSKDPFIWIEEIFLKN